MEEPIVNQTGTYLFLQGLDYACVHLPEDEINIHGVSRETLFGLIDRKEAYWGSATQGGLLQFVRVESGRVKPQSSRLTISYHTDHGFVFFTNDCGQPPRYRIPLRRNLNEIIPVDFDCQSVFRYPSCAFFSTQTAKQIVGCFVNSDGRGEFERVSWFDLDVDLSEPDAWRSLSNRTTAG